MTMADYRIRGPGLSYEQEFQHHGIMGQRWGVITRNVGVNYVPVGEGGKGDGKSGNALSRGLNSFATGIKRIKDEQAAKKAAKPLNINKLSRKQISRLSNEQLNQAIIRARLENELFLKTHPQSGQQTVAGKTKVMDEILKLAKDVGGDFAKNVAKGALNEQLQKHILADSKLDPDAKIQKLAAYGFKAGNELMAEAKRLSEDAEFAQKSKEVGDILAQVTKGSSDPYLQQRGIDEVDARGLGSWIGKSQRDAVAYNLKAQDFNKIISGIDMSDPYEVAKAVHTADTKNLGSFVPPNMRATADITRSDYYSKSMSDYANAINSNKGISDRDAARAINNAYAYGSNKLGIKGKSMSARELKDLSDLLIDEQFDRPYNNYGGSW